MMNTWVLLSDNGEAVVKNGNHLVRVIVRRGLYPTVVSDGSHFYPRSWQGCVDQDGETVKWNYPAGPLKYLWIQTDHQGQQWAMVVWRVTYSQEPLPPCGRW